MVLFVFILAIYNIYNLTIIRIYASCFKSTHLSHCTNNIIDHHYLQVIVDCTRTFEFKIITQVMKETTCGGHKLTIISCKVSLMARDSSNNYYLLNKVY